MLKFEDSGKTRTSQLAAHALGCSVSEIAKSIVVLVNNDFVYVVILSGDKRIDMGKLAKQVCAPNVLVANPEQVKQKTGYVIGGVPPFPHKGDVKLLIDESILKHSSVWAAAGAPNAVMKLYVNDLVRITSAQVADIAEN
jgi:Cys-tRNA(Pro) deacylase